MANTTIKQLAHGVLELFRRVETFLLAFGAERRCAMRLDRVADRLAAMGARIDTLRSKMEAGMDEAVDADGMLRDSLKGLKEDIRGIRCQLAGMRAAQLGARMQRAFARLSSVAAATYASADKLQWEIDAHDARLAG